MYNLYLMHDLHQSEIKLQRCALVCVCVGKSEGRKEEYYDNRKKSIIFQRKGDYNTFINQSTITIL